VTFAHLFAAWSWKAIPNCPGRFVLPPSALTPQQLIQDDQQVSEHQLPTTRDPVIVAALEDGGVISYRRHDGRYVHTLNTRDGFARKLSDLGLRR
jgi:hypothetical protein